MDAVRAIADTILYEGHLLWPYRASAARHGKRWTIGGVHPKEEAERSGGRWTVSAEFLLEDGPESTVEFTLRFLQTVHRQMMDGDAPVPELKVGPGTYRTRQEAREREITSGRLPVERLLRSPVRVPVAIAAGLDEKPVEGKARNPVEGTVGRPARIVRTWDRVTGTVVLSAERAAPGAVRLRAVLVNTGAAADRDEAARSAMLCAHLVADASGGAFVSPADPPPRLAGAAAACHSDGLWPVLAGPPGGHGTVLAAPIVLYDWPQVAPQTPDDLFGGAGLDRLLAELAAGDPRGGGRATTGTGRS
ncbi:hypothetical protein [Actinomadura montaniterrae]|uniref:Uncharacterized protein n=1 Tax=Actinomadura montaniterrae TaxID=1803903 RepID=A0A6L3VKM3_9ACTN|nr:hypothetical protein [Actinomadura montaniterrae]KAB2371864.1 hypothetical protein F9B16_31175 [Actinomadura montaniterrae]